MTSELRWLQGWYAEQCDGEWEHARGVRIDTLDNPGWSIAIDLKGTDLDGKEFAARHSETSETDWLSVRVEDSVFKGAGDPSKLEQLIGEFRAWATVALTGPVLRLPKP